MSKRQISSSAAAPADPRRLTAQLAILSEMTRLRLLRILEKAELSVGDLATVLQLPQSTISRHLKVLLENEWLSRRAEGTMSRYALAVADLHQSTQHLWSVIATELGETAQIRQDAHRLEELLAARRTDTISYFGRVGGEWDAVRQELFGSAFIDIALLGLLPPHWVIADLGCGTGNITVRLAPLVKRVHAVDLSPQMLSAARKRARDLGNVEFHRADVSSLPLPDASVDAAMLSLILHHVEHPEAAIREAARILNPGGRLLIIDMLEHDRQEYRRTMGHRWLGFTPGAIEHWLEHAGLTNARSRRLPADAQAKGPDLFAAVADKA